MPPKPHGMKRAKSSSRSAASGRGVEIDTLSDLGAIAAFAAPEKRIVIDIEDEPDVEMSEPGGSTFPPSKKIRPEPPVIIKVDPDEAVSSLAGFFAKPSFPIKREDGIERIAPVLDEQDAAMAADLSVEAGGSGRRPSPSHSTSSRDSPPAAQLDPDERDRIPVWDLGSLDNIVISGGFVRDHINDLVQLRADFTNVHENLLRTRIIAAKAKDDLARSLFAAEKTLNLQDEMHKRNKKAGKQVA